MSMNLTPWSKDDLEALAKLDSLLSKNIEWKVNTAELVMAYKSLVWMAGLKGKIDSSIAEVLSVKQMSKEAADAAPAESAES